MNKYSPDKNKELFSINNIMQAINEADNSDVCGLDKVSYNMIKYAIKDNNFSYYLLNLIHKLFNIMYQYSYIPKNFNTSIIKPIIKDPSKSLNDIKNIRPISISNSLAQLFEKVILLNSPKLSKIHKNQFGFKRKTSCNHAIFVVKETILNYLNNRTPCRLASLDAEKAFDRLWRDGLFFKLLDKLDSSIWFILRLYYSQSNACIRVNEIIS